MFYATTAKSAVTYSWTYLDAYRWNTILSFEGQEIPREIATVWDSFHKQNDSYINEHIDNFSLLYASKNK